METYLEKMMEQLNSEELKRIFGNISRIVIIGLTASGRKPWQKEETKKSVLYWFFRSNLVSLSSSRSFTTQSHWSYFAGQCCYSERILPVHLSCRMCDQFAFHHQFVIGTWRSCRIPDNGWCRTVLHDKRHWIILTIHRFSGLSWVHFAKRWRNIRTKRLDQRQHQNWARIGNYNLLLARKIWSWDQNHVYE